MFSLISKISLFTVIISLAIGVYMTPILASVMSSDNFKIQLDSINVGGGMGTSDNFKLEDTAGEIGTGYSESDSYKMHAGYQQTEQNNRYIALTVPDLATMAGDIDGLTGGRAVATGTIHIITNNNIGYSLEINASTSPAMKSMNVSSSASFADYSPAGADPDYEWSVTSTGSSFGFSVNGADVLTRYYNNGSSCNQPSGSSTFDKCWEGVSTTLMLIGQSAGPNEASGTDTFIKFSAESGNAHLQPSGDYSATIIVTAYMN